MEALAKKLQSTPIIARAVPFAIFLALTSMKEWFGPSGLYWIYLLKTLAGVWMLWAVWPVVAEVRWAFSWEAVVVGITVFVMWVGTDPFFPKMSSTPGPIWNPHTQFGNGSPQAWFFALMHLAGSTLVVPPLEEMFYRSFLYRYLIRLDFENVPLNKFHPISFLMTSAVFAMTHHEWLAALLCGFAFQWLVIRKNRLGDAMTAHAITNFLLGLWVICKGAWHYW